MVNPVTAEAVVEYVETGAYRYWKVSRRAIMNLLMNKNMSLGLWINQNLKRAGCPYKRLGSV